MKQLLDGVVVMSKEGCLRYILGVPLVLVMDRIPVIVSPDLLTLPENASNLTYLTVPDSAITVWLAMLSYPVVLTDTV